MWESVNHELLARSIALSAGVVGCCTPWHAKWTKLDFFIPAVTFSTVAADSSNCLTYDGPTRFAMCLSSSRAPGSLDSCGKAMARTWSFCGVAWRERAMRLDNV